MYTLVLTGSTLWNLLTIDLSFVVCPYQFEQMTAEADQYGNELHSTKSEISDLNRMISRLQNEILSAKAQVSQRLIKMDYNIWCRGISLRQLNLLLK